MERFIRVNKTEKYSLAIAMALSLIIGVLFLKPYLILIIVATIAAFTFNPFYKWLLRKGRSTGTAASLTLLLTILSVIIPLSIIIAITTFQIASLLNSLNTNTEALDFGVLGQQLIDWVNNFFINVGINFQITPQYITDALTKLIQSVGSTILENAWSSISGIFGFITLAIIYIYVFMSILKNQDKLVHTFTQINPLGKQLSELYLKRMGSMTKAMIRGQFIIAAMQGFTDAVLLYIGGIHTAFFFFVLILVALSIIPLGGGILVIPIGIIMILTGNILGGLFVILGHLLIVTNIDNIMRPRLVPPDSRLDPALTLLSVFAGVVMFGFLGIVLGPVIMIVLITTLQVYLHVFKDEKMSTVEETKTSFRKKIGTVFSKK